MNGIDFPVERVLDGIDAAIEAGLSPVKVNMVVRRGINEASIVPMAAWARDAGVILRFIEYMDVGHSNGWRLDEVVPAAELVETDRRELAGRAGRADLQRRGRRPLALPRRTRRDRRDLVGDGPVLRHCTRARLSAEGKLYTCLFAVDGTDVREVLRGGATDEALAAFIDGVWSRRSDRYSELRSGDAATSTCPRSRCSRSAADGPAQPPSGGRRGVVHSFPQRSGNFVDTIRRRASGLRG